MKPTYVIPWVFAYACIILFVSCSSEIIQLQTAQIEDGIELEPERPINLEDVDETQTVIKSIPCDQCTHVVNSWTTDGKELNIQPGDTICLDGNIVYDNLVFSNIEGTPEKPIIIKNCDGKVAIVNPTNSPYGVKFQHSHDFKFLGNGGGGDYGIRITTDNGFFLSLRTFTTDFEIANIEIAGKSAYRSGFAGIGIKTSPYEDCNLFTDPSKTAWVMKNIVVRDNYIHDVGGEGLYIGHGFYTGRQESQCAAMTYAHSIKNVRIYNNRFENLGMDGIQVKNCDENVAVFNNYINGYAKEDYSTAQDEGIYIGDGTTGRFYNNVIIDGGTGIMVHGMGNLDIFNNVIVKARDYAFFASEGKYVYRFPDGHFNIFNNTFHSTGTYALAFFGESGGAKRFKNNIFIAPNAVEYIRRGTTLDASNNIFERHASYFKFENFSDNNLRLSSDSPVIDEGIDLSAFHNFKDINGVLRPQGITYDVGAYEYRTP